MSKIQIIFSFVIAFVPFSPLRAEACLSDFVINQVASDFDLRGVELEYGYPVGLDPFGIHPINYEHQKPNAYVYITHQADSIYKYPGNVFVAPPNVEASKNILQQISVNESYMKYVILCDSNLTYGEHNEFVEGLLEPVFYLEIMYTGRSGKYVPVRYTNFDIGPYEIICGINYRNIFEILINNRGVLLVQRSFTSLKGLDSMLKEHAFHNMKISDECISCTNRYQLTRSEVNQKLIEFQDIFKEDTSHWQLCGQIKILERKLALLEKFYHVKEPHKSFIYDVSVQEGASMIYFYEVLSTVQKHIFRSRNTYALERWNRSYLSFISENNQDILDILSLTFPDRITRMYRIEEPPPPPASTF